jgi:hypothetical protein
MILHLLSLYAALGFAKEYDWTPDLLSPPAVGLVATIFNKENDLTLLRDEGGDKVFFMNNGQNIAQRLWTFEETMVEGEVMIRNVKTKNYLLVGNDLFVRLASGKKSLDDRYKMRVKEAGEGWYYIESVSNPGHYLRASKETQGLWWKVGEQCITCDCENWNENWEYYSRCSDHHVGDYQYQDVKCYYFDEKKNFRPVPGRAKQQKQTCALTELDNSFKWRFEDVYKSEVYWTQLFQHENTRGCAIRKYYKFEKGYTKNFETSTTSTHGVSDGIAVSAGISIAGADFGMAMSTSLSSEVSSQVSHVAGSHEVDREEEWFLIPPHSCMKFEQLEISQYDKFQESSIKFKSARFQRKSFCNDPPQFIGEKGDNSGCEDAKTMSWEAATSPLADGDPLPPTFKPRGDDFDGDRSDPAELETPDPKFTNPLFNQQVSIINKRYEFTRPHDPSTNQHGQANLKWLYGSTQSISELWQFVPYKMDEMVWFIKNSKSGKFLSVAEGDSSAVKMDFTTGDLQKWRLVPEGDGKWYRIESNARRGYYLATGLMQGQEYWSEDGVMNGIAPEGVISWWTRDNFLWRFEDLYHTTVKAQVVFHYENLHNCVARKIITLTKGFTETFSQSTGEKHSMQHGISASAGFAIQGAGFETQMSENVYHDFETEMVNSETATWEKTEQTRVTIPPHHCVEWLQVEVMQRDTFENVNMRFTTTLMQTDRDCHDPPGLDEIGTTGAMCDDSESENILVLEGENSVGFELFSEPADVVVETPLAVFGLAVVGFAVVVYGAAKHFTAKEGTYEEVEPINP